MKKYILIIFILCYSRFVFAACLGVKNYWHIDPTYSYILRYDVLESGYNLYAYYFYIPTGNRFYSYQPVRISGSNVYAWNGDLNALAVLYPDCFDVNTLAACQANMAAINAGKVVEWTNTNGAITAATLDAFKEFAVPTVVDDDGDGINDKYDMECPMHDLYWQDCLEGGFINVAEDRATDWLDYQLWQTNPELWLQCNTNNADSDGDGWTDGFEQIHGYDPEDALSKPPAGLGDAYPDQSYAWTINKMLGVGLNGNQNEQDYDSDGWSDGYEIEHGFDPDSADSHPEATDQYPAGDWTALDTDRDGLNNAADTNPYVFNKHDGFVYSSIGQTDGGNDILVSAGYAGDPTDPDFFTNQDEDYYIAENVEESYNGATGDYSFHQNEFTFNDTDHDNLLQKFDKLIPSFDSMRPNNQSNYIINIPLPIPGGNNTVFTLSVIPNTATPGGAAMESMRCIIRLFVAGLMTYLFIRNVWTVLRQY